MFILENANFVHVNLNSSRYFQTISGQNKPFVSWPIIYRNAPNDHTFFVTFIDHGTCFNVFLEDPVQYFFSPSGEIKVSENALYLPADLVASPTSTLRSTTGEDGPKPYEINNPVYTGVTFSSPNYGNATYDTLSGSQNNILQNEEMPELTTNLYTSHPTNPYDAVDSVNVDVLSLEKESFPQITNVENPYETVPDSQNSTVYETIPALPGLHSNST